MAFNIGSDGDINTINVNNRVQGALSQLPEAVQDQGVTVELRSSSILMLVSLISPDGDYGSVFMQNYATLNILDELRQVPGSVTLKCWVAVNLPCVSGWTRTSWRNTT